MWRHSQPVVPALLVDQIEEALSVVDDARGALARAVADRAPLVERREAHARVTHAFDEADAVLRRATATAKQHSYLEWSRWRDRLSRLDTARQMHLLAEQDQPGLRRLGSVRAVDTGMSGPDIGELQHGESRPAGTPATYGLDVDALMTPPETSPTRPAGARQPVAPLHRQRTSVAPTSGRTSPPHAA